MKSMDEAQSDPLLRAAGPEFGTLRDCRLDGTAEIQFARTPAGAWMRRVFDELAAQGRLDLVGFARYVDVRNERVERRDGERVQVVSVVRVHGIMLCMRAGHGSGLVGANEALDRAAETEPAIRRLIAVVGDAPGDVAILVNPPTTATVRNPDGTHRMLQECGVTVPRHAVAKMRRFAATKTATTNDHAKARRVLVGGDLMDEVNKIERLYRERASADLTRRDAAELGESLWDRGIVNAPGRRSAGRQRVAASLSATRVRCAPKSIDPEKLARRVDPRSVEVPPDENRKRDAVAMLRSDPRSAAALEYVEGRRGMRPRASRAIVGARHGVSVEELRAAEVRHAPEIEDALRS